MADEIESNVRRWLPHAVEFTQQSEELFLDGLVAELPGEGYGGTVSALADTVRRVLHTMDDADPAGIRSLEQRIEDPTWWFTFAGQELFPLTFAPCYRSDSSRWAFGSERTYIVFQPRHAFRRRLVTGDPHSERSRELIRRRFAGAGRPYDLTITLSPLEADRFVKPAHFGDPPVRWWQS